MSKRRKRQRSPLKSATQCFIGAVILLILAFVIPLTSVNCSNDGGVQLCFVNTYYGLDAHTFGIVLGVISAIMFVAGIFYLRKHKQALQARQNVAVPYRQQTAQPMQPMTPIQPNISYPPVQNTFSPGNYPGTMPPQPPSNPTNTYPRS